ncbi:MobF family relaxase [Ensifer sp. B1-9]|uniref:MobF family relaxase n=1 Tax=Ensifer sp. B1-9 TaxID=3141455 RepID=UPI003D1FF65F
MFTNAIPINSVEYFREQDKRSRAENMQYYTDNETSRRDGSLMGRWQVFCKHEDVIPITELIKHGEDVQFDVLDKITRGIDPANDDVLMKRTARSRYVAFDCTNNAPKPVSVLYGLAKAAEGKGGNVGAIARNIAQIILEAHESANAKSMDYLFSIDAFQTRQGDGSKDRAGATWYASAAFTHFTSRDGDMQLHTHNVIPNIGRREDGKVGALDNYKYMSYRGAASALYRAEMFHEIQTRLAEIGIQASISKDGRNLTFNGIPEDLCTHFSKRRKAILKKMLERGYTNTAAHQTAAQYASYDTRKDKSELPPIEELYAMWNVEAQSLGHSFETVIESLDMTGRKMERERAEKWDEKKKEAGLTGEELPETELEFKVAEIKKNAVNRVLELDSAFEGRKFLTETLEQLQVHVGADEALRLYENVKADAGLVEIGTKGRTKEPVYSTEAVLTLEAEILGMAQQMQGNRSPISQSKIDLVLSEGITPPDGKTFWLKPEQENMIYAMFGRNQFVTVTGDAGTGKTTAMVKAREVAEANGLKVSIAGPTHRSVDVLQKEVGIDRDRAFSVAKLVSDFKRGKLELGEDDLVIVDEAGMIGSVDWHTLERIALETGCRMVAVGDYKQLPPVAAGAPMRMVVDLIGGPRLMEIARQDDLWQREASKALADNRIEDALMAYIDNCCIIVCADADEVEKRTVERFFDLRDNDPGSIVILATTNAEVARINMAIREQKIARGELTGEAVEIEAVTRGTDGRRTDLSLMTGDRIIIGETVLLGQEKISNNSFGTITAIKLREGEEPILSVRWDDGRETSFAPSEFVNSLRDEDDELRHLPKIAIADAMTFYAAQGMTARHCINASKAPLSTENTYVGYTRHKATMTTFIDGARHANDLAVDGGKTFSVSGSGNTKQEDDELEADVTGKQILDNYISECSKASGKNNASDFLGGAKEFHERLNQVSGEANDGVREEEQLNDNQGAVNSADRFKRKSPFADVVASSAAAMKEREKALPKTDAESIQGILDRTYNAPKDRKEGVSVNGKHIPLDYNEIGVLKGVNLIDYMTRNGAELLSKRPKEVKDRSRGGGGGTALEYQLTFGKGLGCVCYHKANGDWGFFIRNGVHGDIRNLRVWLDGGSKGDKKRFLEASQKLREEFSTWSARGSDSSPRPRKEYKVETPRETFDRILSSGYAAEKFQDIRAWWNGAKEAVSGYLLNRRGISVETQSMFRNGFRCEGEKSFDGQNRNGVMFAIRDGEGNLTGFIRRGSEMMTTDKGELVPFNKMAKDTERHLAVMGDLSTAKRVYVGEAPIDCMSLCQRDGLPSGSVIMALGGSAPETGLADLYKLAKENPHIEFHYVGQNDELNRMGQRPDEYNEQKTLAAIREGNPEAKIETRRPPLEFKDWNDEIRGITRPIPKTPEERAAEIAARQQAKAKLEGYDTPQPPAPKGPEIGM